MSAKQVKICPDCSAEYFSHVVKCADCGTTLLSPEEIRRVEEEKKRLRERSLEDMVVVRQGDLNWMDELCNVLIDHGIASTVHVDAGCNKGCCGDTCRLVVSSRDAEKAHERIEEYFREMHPEMQASHELMSDGKCPACGTSVAADTVECPDCGLPLLIVEE